MLSEKTIIIIIFTVTILGVISYTFYQFRPKSGTIVEDIGRGHIAIGTEEKYNSNPPTSGPHYEEWVKSGIYDNPKDDRNLVHSLEHGYVIISFNCSYKTAAAPSLLPPAYAHGEEDEATLSAEQQKLLLNETANTPVLSNDFNSKDCLNLKGVLASTFEKKGKTRIIVIPRPNLDAQIALTAWGYIDKWNFKPSLIAGEADTKRIEKFIDDHLNNGPEKTNE